MQNNVMYHSLLCCPVCKGDLKTAKFKKKYRKYKNVSQELTCLSCKTVYPVVQNIPVLFKDEGRVKLLIDNDQYKLKFNKAVKQKNELAEFAGKELEDFTDNRDLTDALSWEILFWEQWKEEDNGFVKINPKAIKQYLEKDKEAGGRLKFFNNILKYSRDLKKKFVLNIGAGRDYLLEQFINKKCVLVEQDIVLEPLLYLQKRGAHFCVCCDARELPFKDYLFDAVTSFSVLHHIWPIEGTMKEIVRVARGLIFINEPNEFALIRAAFLLPKFLMHKLKKFYTANSSHSPYEKSINPFILKKIIKQNNCRLLKIRYMRDSWLQSTSVLKRVLRSLNILFAYFFPIVSAHFDVVISRKLKV